MKISSERANKTKAPTNVLLDSFSKWNEESTQPSTLRFFI